jgi:hypothetical protein
MYDWQFILNSSQLFLNLDVCFSSHVMQFSKVSQKENEIFTLTTLLFLIRK